VSQLLLRLAYVRSTVGLVGTCFGAEVTQLEIVWVNVQAVAGIAEAATRTIAGHGLTSFVDNQTCNLADEACEEALLDSTALRRFVGIDLGRERIPGGMTLL
jgi:hypothetical protein